jgi:hypothetical protein
LSFWNLNQGASSPPINEVLPPIKPYLPHGLILSNKAYEGRFHSDYLSNSLVICKQFLLPVSYLKVMYTFLLLEFHMFCKLCTAFVIYIGRQYNDMWLHSRDAQDYVWMLSDAQVFYM